MNLEELFKKKTKADERELTYEGIIHGDDIEDEDDEDDDW